MLTQDQLAERNQRIVSWMIVPLLILFMIAALIVPALIEPSEHPPVESMFDGDATLTPTTTPTITPTPADATTSTPASVPRVEQQMLCDVAHVSLCMAVYPPGGASPGGEPFAIVDA